MTAGITIVGLGPGDPNLITREAWQVLTEAAEVHLRTTQHGAVPSLPASAQYRSFDDLYEEQDTLEAVYPRIVDQLLSLAARDQGVIYAVPGHPLIGETTVQLILHEAPLRHLPVRIIAGVSFIEAAVNLLTIDPLAGLQVCNADQVAAAHHPNLDPDVAALVMQVHNRHLAGLVKLTLMNLYPDEQPIQLISGLGTQAAAVTRCSLVEMDRFEHFDHLTSLYISPLQHRGSLSSYQDVIAHLRAPDGCPWDREQTHASLRTHLLEETYEVLDALDSEDMPRLCGELGDLLLQVIMHAQIATEEGDFKLVDAVRANIDKLVRRHPHVFGNTVVEDSAEVLRNWEQIKRQERGDKTKSLLDGVSRALPALSRAMEIQRRVARVGFDWPDAAQVMAKVMEELAEWQQAGDAQSRADEFGDLLFSLVNLARWYELDAESALRSTNQRFTDRFAHLERTAAQDGKALEQLSAAEMDFLWEQAKEFEDNQPDSRSNREDSQND